KNWQYADAAAKRSKTAADTKQFLKHSEKFGKRTSGLKMATDRMSSEESEQIDELSIDTLKSYTKKATAAKEKNWQYADAAAKRSKTPADTKQFLKHSEKFGKRTAGIKKAADKMSSEEE
ncbi:MAG: hypothetical protein EBT98_12865, partial [Opitutaceae bacterium]|nr:hypothetical protein [Opitutaceae bacterium]